ncbi:eukaryotic protein [Schizosaccharomyces japonicus yFS275]|uniref:Eukaryotic protein n=1 Tax=Schizosaccharomyces japonicus (strain yFS275 / FY16936) TaxID=402676 RepID=B6JY42_SCHJY|nr:eukaryotic protein [Schizosaccharomyces japonicus yFS275]EEB06460.2 eukaryotic protein [Schizosaccharomyces japonicus yFS275]
MRQLPLQNLISKICVLPFSRRFRMSSQKRIATHSGKFHADESLAVYMLRCLEEYRDAKVIRTRDLELIDSCDIAVDVGGKFDGVKYFDHHQREFNDTFSPDYKTKLSSAGLVYKYFGKRVITSILPSAPITESQLDLLHVKIYREFIEGLDADDNGISPYPAELKPAFRSSLSLPGMVSMLFPEWNSDKQDDDAIYEQFMKASRMMGHWFEAAVKYYTLSWLPAKSIVESAVNEAGSSPIIVFQKSCPWKSHLFEIEEEKNIVGQFKYALYSDGKNWRIQAVSISPDSFVSRLPLPEPWRGVRDDALSKLTGIPGCIFVHASGFIGGNATYEGVLEMAKKALNFQ